MMISESRSVSPASADKWLRLWDSHHLSGAEEQNQMHNRKTLNIKAVKPKTHQTASIISSEFGFVGLFAQYFVSGAFLLHV